MKKKARVAFINEYLANYMPNPSIPLAHKDSYTLLVAVLLSAQCTDERVNQVTPALFVLADNAHDMALVAEQDVYDIVKPCGLAPQKSKAIVNLSKILVEKYQGNVPANMLLLEELPGVGHKTASVVIAQAFDQPSFPVDTHIHRLAQRWRLSSGKNVSQTEKDLKRLFDKSCWNKLHLQIIYYAREHCFARTCYGLTCPICSVINEGISKVIITKKA